MTVTRIVSHQLQALLMPPYDCPGCQHPASTSLLSLLLLSCAVCSAAAATRNQHHQQSLHLSSPLISHWVGYVCFYKFFVLCPVFLWLIVCCFLMLNLVRCIVLAFSIVCHLIWYLPPAFDVKHHYCLLRSLTFLSPFIVKQRCSLSLPLLPMHTTNRSCLLW